jgi:tRNA nucleotidyltransferase (CCA-adding enzyme)
VKLTPLDARLAAILPGDSLFAVGGRVRDEIRAQEGQIETVAGADSDYLVAGVALEELVERLRLIGRVDLVGASFAVLKVTVDGETVDVALPRRERSIGVGHRDFEVASGADVTLEEDLARRDFRMNMMARAIPAGDLIDPYGGLADIGARRIDILSPQTFVEDPLRMLRASQFAARFEFEPTAALRTAMTPAAPLVASIAGERIQDELAKLLKLAKKPSIGLELLRETNVLRYVWPELLEGVAVEQNEWHAYDVWGHIMATVDAAPPGDLTLRLAALLHDIGKPRTKDGPHFYKHEIVGAEMAEAMLTRFRFPSEAVRSVTHLVRQHMYSADPDIGDAALRRFIRRAEPSQIEHLFALRQADVLGSGLPKRSDGNEQFEARVRAEIDRKPAFAVTDLAVGGDDVIAALRRRGDVPPSFRGDRRVGDALNWLFEQVTDEPRRNERALLLHALEQYLEHPPPPQRLGE